MVGMIFAQMAPVVDGICVANSMGDEAALAAIATVGPIDYFFNIIAALGGIGCGVMLSRCSGSGEKAKAGRIFTRSLLISNEWSKLWRTLRGFHERERSYIDIE